MSYIFSRSVKSFARPGPSTPICSIQAATHTFWVSVRSELGPVGSLHYATNEVHKYLPWTGLGAAYTFGYRKLESLGVERVSDAIQKPDGTAITSWQQMLAYQNQ